MSAALATATPDPEPDDPFLRAELAKLRDHLTTAADHVRVLMDERDLLVSLWRECSVMVVCRKRNRQIGDAQKVERFRAVMDRVAGVGPPT